MSSQKQKRGRLFVISAPSGAGKSTLCAMMMKKYPELKFSVSYTTRLPRGAEKDGVDYFFVSKDIFLDMVAKNEFLEWADVHGNYYGTSAKTIENTLASGADVILDIDPQGAMQLKQKTKDSVFIFITAPSFDILRDRLIKRGTDKHDSIERRLLNAREEVKYFSDYDYLIINDESDKAFCDLDAIYRAEKLRTSHICSVSDFMNI